MAFTVPTSDSPSLTVAGRIRAIDTGVSRFIHQNSDTDEHMGPIESTGNQAVILWEVTAAEEASNTDLPDWADVGALWYNSETKKLRLMVGGDPALLSSWLTLITVP